MAPSRASLPSPILPFSRAHNSPFHVLASSITAASKASPPSIHGSPRKILPCSRAHKSREFPFHGVAPSIHGSRAPSAPFHPWTRLPTRRDSSHTLPPCCLRLPILSLRAAILPILSRLPSPISVGVHSPSLRTPHLRTPRPQPSSVLSLSVAPLRAPGTSSVCRCR
ncbi:Protein TRAUCO [Zea mays]|nr:Protein TRAUCO [Zea mays]AQL03128.1 Protein TRAUCO [Zea mays]